MHMALLYARIAGLNMTKLSSSRWLIIQSVSLKKKYVCNIKISIFLPTGKQFTVLFLRANLQILAPLYKQYNGYQKDVFETRVKCYVGNSSEMIFKPDIILIWHTQIFFFQTEQRDWCALYKITNFTRRWEIDDGKRCFAIFMSWLCARWNHVTTPDLKESSSIVDEKLWDTVTKMP